MGRHNFQCNVCTERFEATRIEGVVCPGCSSEDTRWLPSINIGVMKKMWHPNLGHDPVEIGSMRQLDQELKKRNLYIPESKKQRAFKKEVRQAPQTEKEAREFF